MPRGEQLTQIILDGSGATLADKVELAIERLRLHEPEEGYWLADSYGKDSTALLEIARMSGVAFEAHHNRTTLDPPELMRFGRKYHRPLGVVEDAPKERFETTLWTRKKFPPMRMKRWCCETLKEGGGSGRFVMTGVRAFESARRSKRRMVERCYQKKKLGTMYIHPLFDWTTEDVWEFIHQRALPYCELYDRGWKRIGCLVCPMATTAKRRQDAEEYPRFKRRYIRAFQKLIEIGHTDGTPFTWKTGEECFEWWLSNQPAPEKDIEGQGFIFENAGV